MATTTNRPSLETILTYENGDVSQWSVTWSTTQIPGMDRGTGAFVRGRVSGRRSLRLGSLALGGLLTMHCRIAASALTGGLLLFMVCLVLAVGGLANPLRYFEVYLGQWSINGPGRAFRVIPMFDGIGIAICLNAIIRAIHCCTVAAIAAVYVMHSVSDDKLPFTYCRDFDLKPYNPVLKDVTSLMLNEAGFSIDSGIFINYDESLRMPPTTTVGLGDNLWRNLSRMSIITKPKKQIETCLEHYDGGYPPLYRTPAYNFFYVEVVQFRSNFHFGQFNITLCLFLGLVWAIIWLLLFAERLRHKRLIWNNIPVWFVIIPWIWVALLALTAINNIAFFRNSITKVFRMGAKEALAAVADALEVAMYIHSSSVGTEIIYGKGLHYYASGHIDNQLDSETVLHSGLVLILSVLHSASAALCAIVDCLHPKAGYHMRESTLWILPMYSKCTSMSGYSHLMSTLIFGGLMFSYITVAFVLVKTALHTIFEYRVKLVFVEQTVAGSLVLACLTLSLVFATTGGVALLDSVDAVMSGIAVASVSLLELVGLLYLYRGGDFVSDVNISMEDNDCTNRISMQWQIIPFLVFITLLLKSTMMFEAEMPDLCMYLAIAPLVALLISVPVRAIHNAIVFLRPAPRRGT